MTKKIIIYILTVICSAAFIFGCNALMQKDMSGVLQSQGITYARAEVTQIVSVKKEQQGYTEDKYTVTDIQFKAKLLSGSKKSTIVRAHQLIDPSLSSDLKEVEVGDKVIIGDTGGSEWECVLYNRTTILIVLGIIFAALLIIFGHFNGVSTILSLIFTILAIFSVFVPAVLAGKNVYVWALIVCIYIVVMTLLLVNGANKKSLAAAIGCFGGILSSGILIVSISGLLNLTGVVDEQSIFLTHLNTANPIDLKAIIYGAMIIGAIGAIMDVAVNIASSLSEISLRAEDNSKEAIFRSGITIGRDVMGTMTNTLILAYIGSSLSVVLLLFANFSDSLLYIFNTEMIVVDILQALIGSFGLILTIPLTSLVCSLLYTDSLPKRKRRRKKRRAAKRPVRRRTKQEA